MLREARSVADPPARSGRTPDVNHDDCARLTALAPASALGALDPDEAAFVRAHLVGCPRPHPELRDAIELAAMIGMAWPDEEAPTPQLRARLLSAARSEAAPPANRPAASPR